MKTFSIHEEPVSATEDVGMEEARENLRSNRARGLPSESICMVVFHGEVQVLLREAAQRMGSTEQAIVEAAVRKYIADGKK